MAEIAEDVRSLLLPMQAEPLLLPNAAVAEVIHYREPEPLADALPWLLGRIDWRGERVPLISFERLLGREAGPPGAGSGVAVLNAIGGDPALRFLALVTNGIPRLVRVERGNIQADEGLGKILPKVARMTVSYSGETALIPDLDVLESMVKGQLAG
ncbi:MAG: chemotaxis protein CheW [Gammaproteobacteria bacterium]|nr:chemotaxis protein CheW [Gammaproteobacteria bacterium]NIR60554.1 chemotaxis protein CheW [Gammaproteobacteria bacterium]